MMNQTVNDSIEQADSGDENALRIVAFGCIDPSEDKCAPLIMQELLSSGGAGSAGVEFDGQPVARFRSSGQTLDVVSTRRVLSHDFGRYLPEIVEVFDGYDLGLVLNWHEGGGARDKIFPVHSSADPAGGFFGLSDPVLGHAVLYAIEAERRAAGLAEYETMTEASHWSGTVHGQDPRALAECPLPLYDVEIGSSPTSWTDANAASVLARALRRIWEFRRRRPAVLFLGGVHFEPSCLTAAKHDTAPVHFGHILPNQWIVDGAYEGDGGLKRLRAAAQSIRGGVEIVAYHDNLKGPIKSSARALADELGIPAVKHRRLRADGAAILEMAR
jgi:D-tyrosyl-tRNA(Tyr) deacylase